MACVDCFNNCGDTKTTDKCVATNITDESLDICAGDSLYEVEEKLIAAIKTALDGSRIVLDSINLSNTTYLKTLFVGKEKNIQNLFELLINAYENLKKDVKTLEPKSYAFVTKCLTGLPANASPNDILQALLLAHCNVSEVVSKFPTEYVKVSDLESIVNQYIVKYNEQPAAQPVPVQVQYSNRMVPRVAYPYFGDTSVFSPSGVGMATSGFDKIYLCNGQNGTPDMRGRAIVGAARGVGGNAYDAAVDPTLSNNPNTNYGIGDKFGENYVSLVSSNVPPFSLTIPAQSFSISIRGQRGGDDNNHSNVEAFAFGDRGTTHVGEYLTKTFTGSTVSQTVPVGSGVVSAHNNRQPSIASAFIMYIP